MRFRVLAASFASLLALAVAARADDAQTSTPENEPESAKTSVEGDVPVDLRGVWLMAASGQMGTAAGSLRNFPELWLVQNGSDGQLDFQMLHREMPPGVQRSIDEAKRTTHRWEPTAADLAELDRTLEELKPADENTYLRHDVQVVGRDRYDELGPQPGDTLTDTAFALKISHVFRPQNIGGQGHAQLMSDDAVYGVRKAEPTRLEGINTRVFLAAGFVPIPVKVSGPFVMHRLRAPGAYPAPQGVAARIATALGNLLRGCR